jgi:hypothetical protein
MTPEDEAFNDIERQAKQRKEAVLQALHNENERLGLYQDAYGERPSREQLALMLKEANEIIFKSCVNLPHWKRTAMRYLKRNLPQAHQQAVDEFGEHPDGRGQA